MGGIISELVSRGVHVDYLTITDGSLGDIGLVNGSLKEIRKDEAINAGKYLGAKEFIFLDHLDGSLKDNTYEAHQDHIITGLAAAQAAISVNLKEYPRGTATLPTDLKAVLFYFTQKPNTFIDITNHFEKKMAATAMHKSQINEEMLALYTAYFASRGQKMSGSDKIFEGVKALLPLHH